MAGIGFRLQKILENDSYVATLKAHFFSILICAGPWIFSILTLFALNAFIPESISPFQYIYFRSVMIYVFALSLIAIGPLHFPITRYLADKLYARESGAMVPVFNTSLTVVMVIQLLIGLLFFGGAGGTLSNRILSVMIFITIGAIWLVMIFLTALRDYKAIASAYALGSIAAVFCSLIFGKQIGLNGYLLGYWIGHVIILLLWSARIFVEFPSSRYWDWDIFRSAAKYPVLIWTGFFYNFALWIDKMVFWMSPNATIITERLRTFSAYDNAAFFAYLTIIPALSLFMIRIETDFYFHYRKYYMKISGKASLTSILRARKAISISLKSSVMQLIRFQAPISLAVIAFAPELATFLKMSSAQVPTFRILVAGAFLHSFFLMVFIIVLYFDFQKMALVCATLFCVLNGIFTYITSTQEMSYYGYGYFFASLIALTVSYYWLDNRIRNLEFYTFSPQPIGTVEA